MEPSAVKVEVNEYRNERNRMLETMSCLRGFLITVDEVFDQRQKISDIQAAGQRANML